MDSLLLPEPRTSCPVWSPSLPDCRSPDRVVLRLCCGHFGRRGTAPAVVSAVDTIVSVPSIATDSSGGTAP